MCGKKRRGERRGRRLPVRAVPAGPGRATDPIPGQRRDMGSDKRDKNISIARRPVVGIPKALTYYRYHVLWETFFRELDIETVISPDTDRSVLETGSAKAVDEMCLSAKIYLGHVDRLIGWCDYIFIPRIVNFGYRRDMCTTFAGMYDIARNIYRRTDQKFLTANIDLRKGNREESAYREMAAVLGVPDAMAKKAYKTAVKADSAAWKARIREEEQRAKTDGTKVMVAGHSYVLEDPYFGEPLMRTLESLGVTVLRADITDRSDAVKRAVKLSPTMKWQYSLEIVGGLLDKRQADGVIFVSAFPCGPDSMVTEMYLRKNNDLPALNLTLDAQSGTAGLETRLESFVDILNRKKAG